MFIIEKPYASEFLVDAIVQNDWAVLDNESIQEANFEEGAFNLVDTNQAREHFLKQEYPLIYSNSENAINWVLENLPQSNLTSYIKFFKDKAKFRELLQEMYPDFYFQTVEYENLKKLNKKEIKFPVVLKPAVGFLSFGVHTVKDESEWDSVISKLSSEMKQAESMYPKEVLDSSKFLIEEKIEGEEFAIDAFYDRNGDVVILNIFQHPFYNEKDVSDRIYITSAEIMVRHMAKFAILLKQIGNLSLIRNFPMHVEVRIKDDGTIIPIEVNPMRFAGWCTTDVARYAWGINVYEHFQNQTSPNWNDILADAGRDIYYFSMAEVPVDVERSKIKNFDYGRFLENYSHVLEVRRINFETNPLFAIIFGSLKDKSEIQKILSLNTKDYIIQ